MIRNGFTLSGRGERGFTLLEIMIALAVLAVGAVCVLSTFAAAIALHLRREADVRTARVMEEASHQAQLTWNQFQPTKTRPIPEPMKDRSYSRDDSVLYTVEFEPVPGLPEAKPGSAGGVKATVVIREEGSRGAPRVETLFLSRTGFDPADLAGSVTLEEEKKADETRKNDPTGRGGR